LVDKRYATPEGTVCWNGYDHFWGPKWYDFTSLSDLAGKIAKIYWYAMKLQWVNAAFSRICNFVRLKPDRDSDSIPNTLYLSVEKMTSDVLLPWHKRNSLWWGRESVGPLIKNWMMLVLRLDESYFPPNHTWDQRLTARQSTLSKNTSQDCCAGRESLPNLCGYSSDQCVKPLVCLSNGQTDWTSASKENCATGLKPTGVGSVRGSRFQRQTNGRWELWIRQIWDSATIQMSNVDVFVIFLKNNSCNSFYTSAISEFILNLSLGKILEIFHPSGDMMNDCLIRMVKHWLSKSKLAE
jgi:hypothetical protein